MVERVVRALTVEKGGLYEDLPFFHPDNFTFGTPLYRAALEAAVQDVPGVRAVVRFGSGPGYYEDARLRGNGIRGIRAPDPSPPERSSLPRTRLPARLWLAASSLSDLE
jgi:hypothetical protein